MTIKMSKENSEKVLSGTTWLINTSQNYFTSLDNNSTKPTGSVKKIVNAILLVPIIVPTAVTASSIGFTMLFLDAVSAQKDDSTLSKIAKGIAKLFIYIIAAAILIPCMILNLVISLIPGVIFYCINRDIFNQKSVERENNQSQAVNDQEYNQRIEEEVAKLEQQNDDAEQYQQAYSQALSHNSQLHNRPDVTVISQVVEGEQTVDQTVIANRINSDSVRNGQVVVRTVGTKNSVDINGIMAGDLCNRGKGFAAAFGLQCKIIEEDGKVEGVKLGFGMEVYTGDRQEATKKLMQSKPARAMLSRNGGILSIEHPGSSQQNSIN